MITKRTVFVLGAGASRPYGFPIGRELKDLVLKEFTPSTASHAKFAIHLENLGLFDHVEIKNFCEALRFSGVFSIDKFLEFRGSQYLEIGKILMGLALLQCEATMQLGTSVNGDWIAHLYNGLLGKTLDDFDTNNLTIVTFNYDRVVEHHLFTYLKNSFGISTEQAKKIVSRIDIIHLHGKISNLPWQSGSPYEIAFGAPITSLQRHEIENIARTIKIVSENIADRDNDFAQAKSRLAEAERVCVLGFGFDQANVERLGLDQIQCPDSKGTAYRQTELEQRTSHNLCKGRVLLYDTDALNLLRSFVVLN